MYRQHAQPSPIPMADHKEEQMNINSNNWAAMDCCSETSRSINNLNGSNSSSHQNSSSVAGQLGQNGQQHQYPETTFYYLTQSSYLRSMCIRMVSNKYPRHQHKLAQMSLCGLLA